MVEIHKPPNLKIIDEIWVGMSEDEDGKNGRAKLRRCVRSLSRSFLELGPLVRCPSRRLCAIPRDNLLGQIDEGAQARGHVAAAWIIQAISRIRGRPLA